MYRKIYFWPQGSGDIDYFAHLKCKAEVIAPSLKAFDSVLADEPSIDYIGTRLHAGIRALQHKRRAIIIGVDNRAAEMSKDINLPHLAREDIDKLEYIINDKWPTNLKINFDAIQIWRSQFIQ